MMSRCKFFFESALSTLPMQTLNNLLKYKNPYVLSRYEQGFSQSKIPAEEALTELIKYFWLCDKHSKDKLKRPNHEALDFTCVMYEEMSELDAMWHTFLLFTEDYQAFCFKYFDYFIHHRPLKGKEKLTENDPLKLERFLSYVYDELGEETLKKWFKIRA